MGFFKKHIGSKLKKARRIGEKVAHGVTIGLRKGGKAIQRGAQIAGKVAPILETIGATVPALAPVGAIGAGLQEASIVGSKAGQLAESVGRSGGQFLEDRNAKSFLERSKGQVKQGRELFKK